MSIDDKQTEKLLQLLRDAVAKDAELREKYQMGEKFRFIRERLQSLLAQAEEKIAAMQADQVRQSNVAEMDDVLVYVYLYNSQGLVLQTWHKFLLEKVYREYSVNRPIY